MTCASGGCGPGRSQVGKSEGAATTRLPSELRLGLEENSSRSVNKRFALWAGSLAHARGSLQGIALGEARPRPDRALHRPACYNPAPMATTTTTTTLADQPLDANTKEFLDEAAASPFDFHSLSTKAAGDERLKRAVEQRRPAPAHRRGSSGSSSCRIPTSSATLAGQIKQHAIDHLDYYLEQLVANVEQNGGHVHFAADRRRRAADHPRHRRAGELHARASRASRW